MTPYKELPILRDTRLFMVEVERIVKQFSRYHKYTIGSELRLASQRALRKLTQAIYTKENRKDLVKELYLLLEELKTLIQIAKELETFKNFKQFEILVTFLFNISKQASQWLKKLQCPT